MDLNKVKITMTLIKSSKRSNDATLLDMIRINKLISKLNEISMIHR